MAETRKIDWVDTAKGLSIIMVVMLYATYSVGEDMVQTSYLHYLVGFMTPLRMPEFFAISGLFLSRTFLKGDRYFFDSRVLKYVYFYVLWATLHIALKVGIASADPALALQEVLSSLVAPYGVLWFLYVLALANVAVWVLRALKVPHWLGFAGALAIEIAPVSTGSYAIDQFAAYFVYFYAGYAFAPLFISVVDLAKRHAKIAVAGLVAWAYMNAVVVFLPSHEVLPADFHMGLAGMPGLRPVYSFLGVFALLSFAGLIASKSWAGWINWLGEHSIVVYVAFALPMTASRIVLLKTGLVNEVNMVTLLVFIASLFVPLALYAFVQKTGKGRFLFERPAFFTLDRLLPQRRGSLTPAE